MSFFALAAVPLVGALIGWITNWLAVKLIFRPYQPVKILGFTLQGVIPKRRGELAESISQVVERELLPLEELLGQLNDYSMRMRITESLISSVYVRVLDRIPSLLPNGLRVKVADVVCEQLKRELPPLISEFLVNQGRQVGESLQLGDMVRSKVNGFPMDKLEEIVLTVASRELKHIEILGGVLGFVIGLVQLVIIMLAQGGWQKL